tara:strand:- start:566 stop:850 length:285 start_codon:yes stop_codon:yes gene_type:complete
MDISGLDKAAVLAALCNGGKTQGRGFLSGGFGQDMTREQAQELLDSGQTYFDYVNGRVMKVDLSTDELDTRLYDRDNGHGAAERAIEEALTQPD